MIYIVKVYDGQGINQYEYDDEQQAREHMAQETYHAELYVWLAGREWFMDSVN